MYYERPAKNRSLWSYFIVALIAALIGGTISIYIGPKYIYGKLIPMPEIYRLENQANEQTGINITPSEDYTAVEAVAKKSMGSVVGITTVQIQRELIWEREVPSSGSGVVVSSNGYILTNSHVVGDGRAKNINVLFENGDKLPGQVLWNDAGLDLAIVKVNATGLSAADLGDSDSLEVGQLAVAIGNPLGLDFQRTVTSGIVSGLNRSIRVSESVVIDDLIQTDASINPGNSGGPLLNKKGEVIGINTVKIRPDAAEGLGFAIPINVAKPIVERVIAEGDFKVVYMGIIPQEVEKYERQYGVEFNVDHGILVAHVEENGPAFKAGLRMGDIITKIDNQDIETTSQLNKVLYKYKKGDKAKLTVVRSGQEVLLDIVFTVVR